MGVIQILAGENLELEVDPNYDGLPVLVIQVRYGARVVRSCMLGRLAVEELIAELQKRLAEM